MAWIYDLILEELSERKVVYYRTFAPFYIISLGAHIMNLRQMTDPILFEHGEPSNTRVHLLFVAPPGYGKSFWLFQFMHHQMGFLQGTGIDHTFESSMTAAGFVGTIKMTDGEPVVIHGAAEELARGIIGIEEFSALTLMMHSQHSQLLDTHLLTALDRGYVMKRLGAGKISYQTGVTVWAGTQPARFDLSSGLGRRFVFMQFVPTIRDQEVLRQARRHGKGVRYNPVRTNLIRQSIRQLIEDVRKIKDVRYDPSFYKLLDALHLPPYEEPLFERMALGYWLTKFPPKEQVIIKPTAELEKILRNEKLYRDEIKRGSEFTQVVSILLDAGGQLPEVEVKKQLIVFGLNWRQATELVQSMIRLGVLRKDGQTIRLVGKHKVARPE